MHRGTRALTSALLVAAIGGLACAAAANAGPAVAPLLAPAPASGPGPAPVATLAPASPSLLPPLAGGAPAPTPAGVARALDAVFDDGAPGDFSASVIDVATGDVLYDRRAAEPAVPASSLKTATAAAALAALDAEATLATRVVHADDGSLLLVGGGDVLLGTGRNQPGTVGRAGLATLAERTADALAALGGRGPETVPLLLDDTLFEGADLHPAWDASLVETNNIAPVHPIALYAARRDARPASPRVSDPGLAAANAFHRLLSAELERREDAGADVPALSRGVSRAPAPAGAEEIARVESATVLEQLRFMAEVSDNYVAEAMGRLVALEEGQPATFGGATAAIRGVLGRLGVDTAGMALADASGLSATNRIAPGQLARLLAASADSPDPDLRHLASLLPSAGATGTLAGRLGGKATRGLLHAKTGTLLGVSTLTGLVPTADGRLLAFSFFGHGFPGSLAPARATLDSAATALARCGCR